MKISFIIPVYNTAKYLNRCVSSILNQTFSDFEVLLIDDGSTDNSADLCDSFAASDKRVKVIHKINGGLSDARNTGIRNAKGDYIIFVDSDDFWLNNHCLDIIVGEIQSKVECDFIAYNCSNYYSDKNTFRRWKSYHEELQGIVNRDKAMISLVESGTFPMVAWLKILKRDFVINNGLFFIMGQIAEDIPWFINVLDKCRCCSFVNHYVYAYRQNVKGSITNVGGERSFHSLLDIVEKEINNVEHRNFNTDARHALYSFLAYEYCILLTCKYDSKIDKQRMKNLKWLVDYDINPKVRMANRLRKIAGWRLTIMILKLYNLLRIHFRF